MNWIVLGIGSWLLIGISWAQTDAILHGVYNCAGMLCSILAIAVALRSDK